MKLATSGFTSQLRQGDVLILGYPQAAENAAELTPREDHNIALGEVTGHTHSLPNAQIVGVMDDLQFVVVDPEIRVAPLYHQEHGTLYVNETGEVINQFEYLPEGMRRNAD